MGPLIFLSVPLLVKNQAHCGSCWSFSTTGSLEGAYAIKNKKLLSFSEEQLVACDNTKGGGKDNGCNGGLMDLAFKHVIAKGGVDSEKDWSYVGVDTACNNAKEALEQVAAIKSYVDVPKGDANALMQAVRALPDCDDFCRI